MVWPFGRKKKEKSEEKKDEVVSEKQSSEEKATTIDEKQLELVEKELGVNKEVLQLALQRLKEMSDKRLCLLCGQPVGEEEYEEFELMGTKLYMHVKCKKKFQKQILKLMRSGQLNKVMEMYARMLKQGLPSNAFTFYAQLNQSEQNEK